MLMLKGWGGELYNFENKREHSLKGKMYKQDERSLKQ